jgi:hypothetical protein
MVFTVAKEGHKRLRFPGVKVWAFTWLQQLEMVLRTQAKLALSRFRSPTPLPQATDQYWMVEWLPAMEAACNELLDPAATDVDYLRSALTTIFQTLKAIRSKAPGTSDTDLWIRFGQLVVEEFMEVTAVESLTDDLRQLEVPAGTTLSAFIAHVQTQVGMSRLAQGDNAEDELTRKKCVVRSTSEHFGALGLLMQQAVGAPSLPTVTSQHYFAWLTDQRKSFFETASANARLVKERAAVLAEEQRKLQRRKASQVQTASARETSGSRPFGFKSPSPGEGEDMALWLVRRNKEIALSNAFLSPQATVAALAAHTALTDPCSNCGKPGHGAGDCFASGTAQFLARHNITEAAYRAAQNPSVAQQRKAFRSRPRSPAPSKMDIRAAREVLARAEAEAVASVGEEAMSELAEGDSEASEESF